MIFLLFTCIIPVNITFVKSNLFRSLVYTWSYKMYTSVFLDKFLQLFFFPNQENMINVPIQNSVFEWVTRLKYKKIEISFNPGQPRSLLEKAMAAHSSTLVWKIPWAGEPGRLQSMGSLLVGHDWATSLSLFTSMHWRRKWQPTPVFLPGESLGWGNLVGCRLWGHTQSDTTEAT